MALYRTVLMSFWTDSKVVDDFTPEDRYFYLYLFTNPHTNLAGCYEISMKQVVAETGYSRDTIESLLNRFETFHGVLRYSARTKEVLLLNWHKYNWTRSEKFRKPLLAQIEAVKNKQFKAYLMNLFNDEDTISIPYPYGTDTTNTVTNTISNTDIKPTVKKARNVIPPTEEMVATYVSENGYNVDVQTFMDFYESKGWKVGKNKMTDWQAAVRNWARSDYRRKGSTNPFAEMLRNGDY